jgi:hypothetical protein
VLVPLVVNLVLTLVILILLLFLPLVRYIVDDLTLKAFVAAYYIANNGNYFANLTFKRFEQSIDHSDWLGTWSSDNVALLSFETHNYCRCLVISLKPTLECGGAHKLFAQ